MILFLDGGAETGEKSVAYLEKVKEHISDNMSDVEIKNVRIDDDEHLAWEQICRYLEDAGAIVLAAPVFMDSVPAAVLSFLERVEKAVIEGESIGGYFYAILYTDLYEGEQTGIAMGVLRNFCIHANIRWGRGLGIGGSCLQNVKNLKPICEQALYIEEGLQGTDVYISPQELSRGNYIRKINRENRKNNRAKFAKN